MARWAGRRSGAGEAGTGRSRLDARKMRRIRVRKECLERKVARCGSKSGVEMKGLDREQRARALAPVNRELVSGRRIGNGDPRTQHKETCRT